MNSSVIPVRIEREKYTVSLMIGMWCHAKHDSRDRVLCGECRELEEYAHARLERCRYGALKPACKRCKTHCYRPAMREAVRLAMRYAGPRMILHHPIATIRHLFNI